MSFPGDDHHIYRGWPNRDVGGPRAFNPFHPYSLQSDGRALNGRRPDALTSFSRHSNDDEILRPHRQGGEGKGKEKNDMEDPRGRARFGEYLISTTGFQGPGKIREAPFTWLKVLWILGFLVACGFMMFQLVKLFEEFFSFPTKTVVELKFSPLPLPALTLCNVNPVRRSFANNLSCPLQSLFKIPDHLRSEDCAGENFTVLDLDAFDYYCDDCEDDFLFEEDLDDFAERRENIALFLGSEDRETRRYVGHQLDDMVIDCYLFGRPCSFRNVTGFLSRDYGNCYTLSMPNVKATKSGQEAALELTLNLEAEEFIEGYKTGYGIRVVLHENGARPFPSSQGFTLSSGSETDIAVRMTQVKRKGGRYGKCDQGDVVAAISGYKYTIANCQDQCVHKKMVDDCGCIPLDDEEEEDGVSLAAGSTAIKFCSTEAEYKCTYKAWDDYVNASVNKRGSTCSCHTPCEELIYTSTLSTRTWPILSHLPVLEEQVCKLNDQSPKCLYLGVDFTIENLDIRRSFSRVRLYYEQLNYEFVEEQAFYDTERFLSDIGGTLGLWIGVTALGLLELFELFFLALNTCRRRKSRA